MPRRGKYGPIGGCEVTLENGGIRVDPPLIDEYPEATRALMSDGHQQFTKALSAIPCNCCPVGRSLHNTKGLPCEAPISPVIGQGSRNAEVVFVGEAPGKEEWISKTPFTGKSGQTIRNVVYSSGVLNHLKYGVAYVNIVMCYPFDLLDGAVKDRKPGAEEAASCVGFLMKQLFLIRPRIIVALGKTAAVSLFGMSSSVKVFDIRGRPFMLPELDFGGYSPVGLVTYHPAAYHHDPSDAGKKEKLAAIRQDVSKIPILMENPYSISHLPDTGKIWTKGNLAGVKSGRAAKRGLKTHEGS